MRLLVICFSLLALACTEEEKITIDDAPLEFRLILGNWQLNGSKVSIGGPLPDDFQEISDGPIFSFELNSTYRLVSNNQHIISEGTFVYNEDSLIISPQNGEIEEESSYIVTMRENEMVLSPSGPILCIEGCLYRYIKLD
ncbi:lipocalin family protein [Croceitalea rosinachiae]|uniref:Lipocalin family protein n=1 Tax=Croceitalea rosinachiae TaxID=3075596 RepID=A0ABU3AA74_9FLAO|nr:lipocalin family protein [Croceitalea sp. F388]MDT0607086.1 lipocalin family protein [Croceitalea sp. F388]